VSTTLPAIVAQPDLEAWVWQNVSPVEGVTSFCYAAVSAGWPHWIVAYSVQVDARASTKQAARDRADQVRQIVLGLPNVPWPAGVCCTADPIEGPFWLPDDDAGPRYVARYIIQAHPPP
jgi:hypothetical protein